MNTSYSNHSPTLRRILLAIALFLPLAIMAFPRTATATEQYICTSTTTYCCRCQSITSSCGVTFSSGNKSCGSGEHATCGETGCGREPW